MNGINFTVRREMSKALAGRYQRGSKIEVKGKDGKRVIVVGETGRKKKRKRKYGEEERKKWDIKKLRKGSTRPGSLLKSRIPFLVLGIDSDIGQ